MIFFTKRKQKKIELVAVSPSSDISQKMMKCNWATPNGVLVFMSQLWVFILLRFICKTLGIQGKNWRILAKKPFQTGSKSRYKLLECPTKCAYLEPTAPGPWPFWFCATRHWPPAAPRRVERSHGSVWRRKPRRLWRLPVRIRFELHISWGESHFN